MAGGNMTPRKPRNYVLCAGMEYHKCIDRPFIGYCEIRKEQVISSLRNGQDANIAIYNFRTGAVQRTEVRWVSGKKSRTCQTKKEFQEIRREHFGRVDPATGKINKIALKDNVAGIMSITDIYEAVQRIGDTAPNSVKELSFFSHAYWDGPILVNSTDDRTVSVSARPRSAEEAGRRQLPRGQRDPDDKDGRAALDFTAPNMQPDERQLFHDAFEKAGVVWVWGCNWDDGGIFAHVIMNLVQRYIRNARPDSIDENKKFEFKNLDKDQVESLLSLNDVFRLNPEAIIKTRKCSLTFKAIKMALRNRLQATYSYKVAEQTGVTSIGALFGTYAAMDQMNPPLMAIDKWTREHGEFYRRFFGFKLDPEGRGYGIFDPQMPIFRGKR